MVKKAKKPAAINIRTAPEIKRAALEGAKRARRSLTGYIESLILRDATAHAARGLGIKPVLKK